MKDLEKQLRKEAEKDAPDLYNSIMAQADGEGLFEREVNVGGGVLAKRNIKPFIFTACAFLLAAAITLGIVLPLLRKKPTLPTFSPIELSVDEFYGAGALSSVKLLSENVNRRAKAVDKVKGQIDYFDSYLSSFDAFLGDGFINTVSSVNTNPQYAQYEKTMTVSASELGGSVNSYVMYYNETLVKEDEDEKEFALDGIMTLDGEEYLLHGERSEENDGGEAEEELKIRAYTAANPENFVEVEQEISAESGEREVEYVYRIYRQNKLVEETEVEFEEETEKGKKKVGFKLEFKSGNSKGKYKAERKGDGALSVKYDIDGESGTFSVSTQTADGVKQHIYRFSDGSEIIK